MRRGIRPRSRPGRSGPPAVRTTRRVAVAVALASAAAVILLLGLVFGLNRGRRTVKRRGGEEARPTSAGGTTAQPSGPNAQPTAGPTPLADEPRAVASFSVQERFGVWHPDQIIDFDLDLELGKTLDPADTFMLGPDGEEVPCQLLEGGRKVAVRTGLAPGESKTWKLMKGRPPSTYAEGVSVTEKDGCYEITNGLTGIRVPPSSSFERQAGAEVPAPVQGVRLRGGTWTGPPGPAPNRLSSSGEVRRLSVRFVEKGPLKVVVELSYEQDRPELRYGQQVIARAGPGLYRSTVEVQAGQPSIVFEEETDTQFSYTFWLRGLEADQARYRGHHSNRKEHGYEADGVQYRQWHERPALDAFFDLPFDREYASSYGTNLGEWPSIRRMAVWDPWVFDSGWYWQLYRRAGGPASDVLGIFAGRASHAVGAGCSGVGVCTKPDGDGGPLAGLSVQTHQRGPDARLYPRIRLQWGLFVGSKRDLSPPGEVQPIARQMNLHGGIGLNRVHRLELDFPDPRQGYGTTYMPAEARGKVIERLRQDEAGPHGKGFHGYLYSTEPSARPLIAMWKDASGEKLKEAVKGISEEARKLLDALVNGDGIYDFRYHYWHGGLAMSRKAVWIDQVLASDLASEEDKAKAKAAAVLFASILWDDDFVPLFDGHGLNLGTPNMPIQQMGYRHLYAVLLSEHPMMRERVKEVRQSALAAMRAQMSEEGAHMGSSHYIGAALGPTLSTLQQLRMAGIVDAFSAEPRLARFADLYMNFLTPPEPRFGGVRKIPPIGDGSTQSSELYGQLGTAFAGADVELSSHLMWAWRESGGMHSGFHGTTLLKIDEGLPAEDPKLASASFAGYYSVLRTGWSTREETAVWLVDGGFYRDHYHNDLGEVIVYALGAPLSLDFGSMYSPRAAGGLVHSVVLPASALGDDWKAVPPPLEKGGRWGEPKREAFRALEGGAFARASFGRDRTRWTRAVSLAHLRDDLPVIAIQDVLSGGVDPARIFSLNLMAEGEIETPEGRRSPGQGFELKAGTSRLRFTGQTWPAHPAKGIDWDVWVVSPEPQEAFITCWKHAWHPGREQGEFSRANGRAFEESQHILRVKGKGPLRVFILPWHKGKKPADVHVTQTGAGVSVSARGRTVHFRRDGSFSR